MRPTVSLRMPFDDILITSLKTDSHHLCIRIFSQRQLCDPRLTIYPHHIDLAQILDLLNNKNDTRRSDSSIRQHDD